MLFWVDNSYFFVRLSRQLMTNKKKLLTASVFSISMHAFHSIIYISFSIFTDIFEIVLNILEQMARGRTVPERSSMKWFDYLDYTASCLQIKFMIIKILYKSLYRMSLINFLVKWWSVGIWFQSEWTIDDLQQTQAPYLMDTNHWLHYGSS